MPIAKLSTNPALITTVENVRKLIDDIDLPNDNTGSIIALIKSEQNANGAFYKYYFDTPTGFYNPAGNNILLLAIAKGAMNPVNRDTVVAPLVDAILEDARSKLTSQEFQEFISFKFTDQSPDLYYFDNTPLTLAIMAGMIDTASKLVDLGADVNATSYGQNGQYTPLHLLALRLPRTQNPAELELMAKIKAKGASLEKLDVYGRSVQDLANLHDIHIVDVKKFAFCKEREAQQAGLPFLDEPNAQGVRLIKDYSLNELYAHPGFRTLYESKYGEALPTGTEQEKFAAFKAKTNSTDEAAGLLYPEMLRGEEAPGKFNCFDAHIIQYDGHFPVPTHLSGGEKHPHHYDSFHGTDLHNEECTIIGVAPCQGHGGDEH